MDQKSLTILSKWLLVIGGLVLAYQGLMGRDIVEQMFGGMKMYVDIIVFGIPAVYLAYVMLTKPSKKK
jgi:uncharacterized membrane protein YuzA (DUF378 family)